MDKRYNKEELAHVGVPSDELMINFSEQIDLCTEIRSIRGNLAVYELRLAIRVRRQKQIQKELAEFDEKYHSSTISQ